MRVRRVSRRISGVFIRGFPPNKKTTRQRTNQDEQDEVIGTNLSLFPFPFSQLPTPKYSRKPKYQELCFNSRISGS